MANIGSWYPLNQEGFRIGDRGTKQGIIGFSAHMAYFKDLRSADAAWAAFKQQLADIVDMMPYPDDPDAEAKLKPALAAWDAFVRRW